MSRTPERFGQITPGLVTSVLAQGGVSQTFCRIRSSVPVPVLQVPCIRYGKKVGGAVKLLLSQQCPGDTGFLTSGIGEVAHLPKVSDTLAM